jgi:dTDP-4-amino-4,6-dideoxygalactose transaminase
MMAIDAIQQFALTHGLWVVEDAAHAFPAAWRRGPREPWQHCGEGTARVTCFSFYANKTMTTGEGGMAVTDDPSLASRIRLMSLHGLSHDAWDRYSGGGWDYRIVAPGYKYNLTDIAAAIGLHQLKKARRFAERRAAIAGRFNDAFASLPVLTAPGPLAGELHAWHLYALRVADEAATTRDRVIERLFVCGIGCSVHYIPLHLQPYWRDRYRLTPQMFPHSQRVYERQLSLPIYTRMTDADVERVIRAVEQAVGSAL